jgi:hypothetical protein
LLCTAVCACVAATPSHARQPEDEAELQAPDLRERWRSAEPEERRRMRRQLRQLVEHWADTSAAERSGLHASREPEARPRLGDAEGSVEVFESWRHELRDDTSPAERRQIRRYLQGLDDAGRRALRERVERYRALDAPARRALRHALQDFRALPAEHQQRFRDNAQRWRRMSPETQQRLRERMALLRGMDPQDRLKLLESVLPE